MYIIYNRSWPKVTLQGITAKRSFIELYRGMKGMHMDMAKCKEFGGVEMAPMSTSNLKSVANNYAAGSQGGLLFETRPRASQRACRSSTSQCTQR